MLILFSTLLATAAGICVPEPVPGVCENGWGAQKPLERSLLLKPPAKFNRYMDKGTKGLVNGLHRTQWAFIEWSAWRLDVTVQEMWKRYNKSIPFIEPNTPYKVELRQYSRYRGRLESMFGGLGDKVSALAAYRRNAHMGTLRQVSYTGPCTSEPATLKLIAARIAEAIPVGSARTIEIVEYGAGLAERGRCLAEFLRVDHGRESRMHFYDIASPAMQFVDYMCEKVDSLRCAFNDCNEDTPIPAFPERSHVIFAIEIIEHLTPKLVTEFKAQLLRSLDPMGLILTSIEDHHSKGHINPTMGAERLWFAEHFTRIDFNTTRRGSRVKGPVPSKHQLFARRGGA